MLVHMHVHWVPEESAGSLGAPQLTGVKSLQMGTRIEFSKNSACSQLMSHLSGPKDRGPLVCVEESLLYLHTCCD